MKKYALKKLKKMNNSTSCSRKNTFLRISFYLSMLERRNRIEFSLSEIKINFKKVKLYLQYSTSIVRHS